MKEDLLLRILTLLAFLFAILALAQTKLPNFVEKKVMEAAIYIEQQQKTPTVTTGTRGDQRGDETSD